MTGTAAILPIKRFTEAKQRLDVDDRGAVMREMVEHVLGALDGSAIERLYVVTGDRAAEALAVEHGATVVAEGPLRGHSAAAALGVERAVADGVRRVLLLAGDCPLLTSAEIDALLAAHDGDGVVVLADRHGTGTNGLLLQPPAAIAPAFGPGSRERHERLAREAGVRCVVEQRDGFALDVDTRDDLEAARRVS